MSVSHISQYIIEEYKLQMKTMWVVFDFPCGPYRKMASHRCHLALFFPLKPDKEVKKQIWDFTVKHLLQSPLWDDVKYCSSSWNSLAQTSATLMQWKQPPLFKWLFDLIYCIIQILEGISAIVLMIVRWGVWLLVIRLVFSTVILNHKGIPGIHLN